MAYRDEPATSVIGPEKDIARASAYICGTARLGRYFRHGISGHWFPQFSARPPALNVYGTIAIHFHRPARDLGACDNILAREFDTICRNMHASLLHGCIRVSTVARCTMATAMSHTLNWRMARLVLLYINGARYAYDVSCHWNDDVSFDRLVLVVVHGI
jgi:hypothetical protein